MSSLRVLGVIVAVNKNKSEDFSAKDKEHFASLCEFCSLVISNCQSQKELVRLRVKSKVGNAGGFEFHFFSSPFFTIGGFLYCYK